MARKRKQNTFEGLIDIAAMLPWWLGVLFSLIIYFILHHFATAEVPSSASPAQIGVVVSGQLSKTLAMIGQYLLPFAFLIGAGISAYGQHKRKKLLIGVQKSSSLAALNDMSWQEFEMLVGAAFQRRGYTVSETGGGGADGGIDIILNKNGEKFLVQCKQWKALKVGVTTIRELYGVMAATGATGGFVVTSGVFTIEAKSFAEGRNVDLIDGTELTAIIKQLQPNAPKATLNIKSAPPNSAAKTLGQTRPKCGNLMVKRMAKQGANAGKEFWGCSNFPQCRGVIQL